MYAHWLNKDTNATQDAIAISEGISAQKGLNIYELADALENYTPNWFSSYSTSTKDNFVKKIISENKSDQPVVVLTSTRYSDPVEEPKPNKHYMLVDGFTQNTSKYSDDVSSTTGFHINDPLWDHVNRKSKYSAYEAVDGRVAFPMQEFMSEIASKSSNKYYLVRD